MKNFLKIAILAIAVLPMCIMTSCESKGYEPTDGVPTIKYIRPQDVNAKDSLLTEAYLQSALTIVGENLTSIVEMYFNDQKAVLNTSYMTAHTLLVTVPKNIPGEVNDKITMVTKDGQTVEYPFHVIVPGPTVSSMDCEYVADGDEAYINGLYFVDDPNVHITVTFIGIENSINVEVPYSDIKVVSQSRIRVKVPAGAEEGQIKVTTIYGSADSKFYFRDTRGIITDFDGPQVSGKDYNASSTTGIIPQGWNIAAKCSSEGGISGNYVELGSNDVTTEGGWVEQLKLPFWCGNWNGDPMSITKGSAGVPVRNCIDVSDWQNMSFKMELYIPKSNPWSAGAMQILFANYTQCCNDSWQNNIYIHTTADLDATTKQKILDTYGYDVTGSLPRALYNPWAATGSYSTEDQWITVTIPLTDFIYDDDGTKTSNSMSEASFDSFVIWPMDGGVSGTECSPVFRYDNIRIVPNL